MRGVVFCCLGLLLGTSNGFAAPCRGNPQALGTSRTITVTSAEYPKVGSVHYASSPQLPLNDHEIILTFDDGPLSPYTGQILDALAKECVKATFFLVGRQATAAPDLVKRIYNEGHTIGTHSQNHPLTFDQMPPESAEREITDGIKSVSEALGDPRAVAPFFRTPGFLRIGQAEDYLASQSISVWSTDADADDWYRTASPQDVVTKAINRLADKKHHGVLLLHDVQPVTALALPLLLSELKAKGYKIVQAVPAGRRVALNGGPAARPSKESWPRTSLERPARTERRRPAIQWTYGTPRSY